MILGASVLGGVLALDATSVGQLMLSRPLAAGLLSGWIAGDVPGGLLVGVILEIYLLVAFPVGGARFPEGATATVVGAVTAATYPGPGALALAVGIGLAWGQVGGWSISALRTLNGGLAPDPTDMKLTPGRVVGGHLFAVVLDFLRGALVTGTGVWLAARAVERLAGTMAAQRAGHARSSAGRGSGLGRDPSPQLRRCRSAADAVRGWTRLRGAGRVAAVTALPLSTRVSVLLRSFTIQGSWNYRTMLGGGFAFAILPVLRRVYSERD